MVTSEEHSEQRIACLVVMKLTRLDPQTRLATKNEGRRFCCGWHSSDLFSSDSSSVAPTRLQFINYANVVARFLICYCAAERRD